MLFLSLVRKFVFFGLLLLGSFVQLQAQTHRIVVDDGNSIGVSATANINTTGGTIQLCPAEDYTVEKITASAVFYEISALVPGSVTFWDGTTWVNGPVCSDTDFRIRTTRVNADINIQPLSSGCGSSAGTPVTSATLSLVNTYLPTALLNGSPAGDTETACVDPSQTTSSAITFTRTTCGGVGDPCPTNTTVNYAWYQRTPPTTSYTAITAFSANSTTHFYTNGDLGNDGDVVVLAMATSNVPNSRTAPSPAVCYDYDSVVITTRHIPSLVSAGTAIQLADGQICENVTEDITAVCGDKCPTMGGSGRYRWLFRQSGASGGFGTVASTHTYSADQPATTHPGPNGTGVYSVDPSGSGLNLAAGEYDVFLAVTNDAGCSDTVSTNNAYRVNPRPGLMVLHDSGDPNNWATGGMSTNYDATTNAVNLCTGRELQLRVNGCADSDYVVANSSNASSTTPNIPPTGPPGIYNSPCNTTNPDYFASIRLRVDDPNVGGNNNWMLLNLNGGVYTADTTGTGANSVLFNPHDATNNTFTVRTMQEGVVSYLIAATGENGCTSFDRVTVNVTSPTITYTTPTGGPYADGSLIPGCAGDVLQVTPICDLCDNGTPFATVWSTSPATGNNTIALPAPTTSATPVSTQTITVGNRVAYALGVVGNYGCTNSNQIDNFDVEGSPVSTVSRVDYPAQMCSGDNLIVDVTGHEVSSNYEIFLGDPDVSGTVVCSPCTEIHPNPIPASPYNMQVDAGTPPVNGGIYYIRIYRGGGNITDCPLKLAISNPAGTANVPTAASVGTTPDLAVGGTSFNKFCNASTDNLLSLDLNGRNPVALGWNITWSGRALTGSPNPATPVDLDRDPFDPSLFLNEESRGLCFTFFGRTICISSPYARARINPTTNYYTLLASGGGVRFTATVDNGGCEQVINFPDMDFDDCDIPILRGTQMIDVNTAATSPAPAPVDGNPDFASVCAGQGLRLEVASTDTTLAYLWSSGETTSSITIMTTLTSPDSFSRTVDVYTTTSDTFTLSHTFYVSKGIVNFTPGVDTTICRGDVLIASANCPTCIGEISYEWDSSGTVINALDGSTTQFYVVSASPTAIRDTLSLDLRHGPSGTCTETIVRQLIIAESPAPIMTYQQTLTAPLDTLMGNTTSQLFHRCIGQDALLTVDCSNCGVGPFSYDWNTGATSPAVTITSAGGYYVEVSDSNNCRAQTSVAVIVDAADGATTPAVAMPTEICNGQPVTLEVAPCLTCSYQWLSQVNSVPLPPDTVGRQRTYATTTGGNFFAEIMNSEGCVYTTNTVVVTTASVATPVIAASTDTICAGQTATLSTPNSPGFQFQWYKRQFIGGVALMTPIAGATDSTYTTKPDSVGFYEVMVTYPNGCQAVSLTFQLHSGSFVPVASAIKNEICRDETVEVSTNLVTGYQYQWYRNGISILGETGSSYYADSAGSYYVLVTSDNLCQAQTIPVTLTKSTLTKPNASTSTPTICPGEQGRLSVSLCNGCSYQWFNTDPTAISSNSSSNFNYNNVQVTGNYFAVVEDQNGSCNEVSDTVTITQNQVFTPSINAISSIVCDGVDATLVTQGCANCSYTWLLNNSPALGALNDTFIIINSITDVGDYRVAIDYPNGCSDTSTTLTVTDGSFNAYLSIDTVGGRPLDSVICNSIGENLLITDSATMTGTYVYTLFLDNTPVTNQSNIVVNNGRYTFTNRNSAGVYTAQIINPDGCRAVSNILPLRSVTLSPMISSRATLDPNSVPATAICTDSASVVFQVDVGNCPSCTYIWSRNGTAIPGATSDVYQTPQGFAGTGLYIVSVTEDGCVAASTAIGIANSIGTVNTITNTQDTSICNGDPATLRYAGPTCTGCSYRWLRGTAPINGATTSQYVATVAGEYFLEITTGNGCIDLSDTIRVQEVTPPLNFGLYLDSLLPPKGTPLAANSSTIDLNDWIFPNNVRHATLTSPDTGYFTSTPFSANINCGGVIPCYPGLSGSGNSNFTPADSLAGFFDITYYYTTNGCTFTTSDILEVLEPARITITNANPAAVPYEACIGDVLTITTTNTDSAIGSLFAFDLNGNYIQMTPDLIVNRDTTFGSNTFWNSTIVWTVPDSAYASNLVLRYVGGQDSVSTPFLLIHNTDLSFSGLPSTGELCSNGAPLTLFGNPQDGSFAVEDTLGNAIGGTTLADTLYPSLIDQTRFANGEQWVNVVYNYTETYTNGNLCPDPDRVAIRMNVKDVRLTGVEYNDISVSQTQERLTNLVYRTYPYEARPNKQPLYTSTFSGSFTSPAGSPEYFLPANAGVGRHALTYSIQNGVCINSIEDSITVVAAPTPIALNDTICRDQGVVSFARDFAFPFGLSTPPPPNISVTFTDSVHVLRVSGAGVTAVNTNLGSETFTYDPSLVAGNHDTLLIEYVFYRDEDTLGVDFDTLEYVVASIRQPIFVENPLTVQITDTIVSSFYCQENTLKLLAASPPDTFGRGLFMLFGGTNQYQNGDTLFNNVLNPFDINNLENATTTYDLVYILNGVACRNADTMQVTIAKGLNPAFATANSQTEFCDDDPAVAIIQNVLPPDTAIWKIGGIPQPSYSFSPAALNPDIHVVELQQLYTYAQGLDTFVCSASAIDTFVVYALPTVSISPALDAQYCANDSIVDFVVSPSPDCPAFGANGQYLVDENFDQGIPPSWVVTTLGGANWGTDVLLPQGGTGAAAFLDTSGLGNNSWLIGQPMNLITGHTYRLSYMVRAGAANANCSGLCGAALFVGLGTAATPTGITSQLDNLPDITNDQVYTRQTQTYVHTAASGTYYLGFRNYSPAYGRSLRLDNVEFRDLTVDSCAQAGIGFVNGLGTYRVQDSLYQFDPLSVPAGNITVSYEYTDIRGCSNITNYNITVDTAPVVSFTNLDSSYCENDPTVMLTGSPLGGNFSSTLGTNLVNIPFVAPLDTAFFPVNYQTNVPGTDVVSYSYTDGNGCTEVARDTVVVVPLLDVNIIDTIALDPDNNGHCVLGDSAILTVGLVSGSLFTNGVFYGPGVRNGAAGAGNVYFYPNLAASDMGHTGDADLMYVYTTSTGCNDTSRYTTRVHAMPDLSFVNFPDSLCLNRDSFQVQAQNRVVTGAIGQTIFIDTLAANSGLFTATDVNGNSLPNFIQLFDTLYPYEAGTSPWVHLEYTYTAPNSLGGCSSTISDSVRMDSVPIVYFQGLRPYYCEDEPQSIFLGFPSYYVGSGYLLIDTTQIDSSFYWIDPAVMVGPGPSTAVYPTYYTYTDTRGCTGEVFDTFEVRPYPRITFSPTYQDTFCRQVGLYDLRQSLVGPLGGYFTDNLALTSIVDSFYLNLNSQPGPRLIIYNYTDPTTLCSNKDSIWIYLFSAPELDFQAFGGCAQMDIAFEATANNLVPGIDSITRIWWDFEGNGVLTNSHLDPSAIRIPDTTYQYATNGVYNVTLYVDNQGGCVESVTKQLIVSPYYDLASGDYFEDFNTNAGDWHSDQPATITPDSVWTHEMSLAGNQIISNDGAWVTMKNDLYTTGLEAWVYSPCYDFSTSRRPMLAFDLWRDLLFGIDGMVLEYYNNTSRQWELVGDVSQGINWYQSDFVLARPGNQLSATYPKGWTGRGGQFESARVRLDQFKGQRDIRFRLAFSTSPQTVIDSLSGNGYEGAAFDNVWIGERTRNVLVEHFSNENYSDAAFNTSATIDQAVYNKIFNPSYGLDVILLQYQVDKDGYVNDQVYATNEPDFNARSLFYSAGPNEIFIDGRVIGTGESIDLNEWEMDYDMLQFPAFDIRIDQPITITSGNNLTASATIEALQDMPDRQYSIRMIAMQDSLTFTSDPNSASYHEMLSVARKIMPSNIGFLEHHAWTVGQTSAVRESWDFSGQIGRAFFNTNQLEVVVFIQDDSTKEVYQAASTQDVNRFNGTQQLLDQDERKEIFSLNVYPNPASNWCNVAFDAPLLQSYNWRLIDVTGRTLQYGRAEAGTQQFELNVERLTGGAYFFVIHSDDNQVYAQRKLIIIRN